MALYLFRSRSGFAIIRPTPELPDRDSVLVAHYEDLEEEAPLVEPRAIVPPSMSSPLAPAPKR